MNWIYEKNKDNTGRYLLGTVGEKPLICIGVNPSTAEPGMLDNTLKSVARICEANGFDSWIMLNVYPQRATDPEDMHDKPDYDLIFENLLHIENVMKNKQPAIWAAWGTVITKRPYLLNCLYQIVDMSKDYDCKWYNAGRVSKLGHPHHPLYLEKTEKLKAFDIDEYIKKASVDQVFSHIKGLKNSTLDNESDFIQSLYKADFMDRQYNKCLSTRPVDVDAEMKALKNADYKHARALLTAIMREDYFSNGALMRRVENGNLLAVLRKLQKLYKESGPGAEEGNLMTREIRKTNR
ncbi:DUF1643 domain-containing protein [Parasporobacterium paucivorans]|uniref:DUF1643 domain-containing protein n=1 Tax=Parasporobacterium paucivorans DSM 15970 TaxID=1122934 RepID=A0A1M6HX68_9FIRM|nr:DUF1643 domain-containing protein [Parasporobacterium paucivorans]SHJ26822.1 hypothetical protein SAMN02745691_01636 [Parasporobacterium paucivorans DSM 15970]